ncbi:hypothetical protein ABZ841_37655, partial [Streptomyces flaveolus]
MCVVVFFVRNRGADGVKVLGYVVAPALGVCVTLYLMTQLSSVALTIGGCWLTTGFGCLLWLTRGFRRPTPELSASALGQPKRFCDPLREDRHHLPGRTPRRRHLCRVRTLIRTTAPGGPDG